MFLSVKWALKQWLFPKTLVCLDENHMKWFKKFPAQAKLDVCQVLQLSLL